MGAFASNRSQFGLVTLSWCIMFEAGLVFSQQQPPGKVNLYISSTKTLTQSLTEEKKGWDISPRRGEATSGEIKIPHESRKAHSHSCAKSQFFRTAWLSRRGEKKFLPRVAKPQVVGTFFSPQACLAISGEKLWRAQEWECALSDEWRILPNPFFSLVKDWHSHIAHKIFEFQSSTRGELI